MAHYSNDMPDLVVQTKSVKTVEQQKAVEMHAQNLSPTKYAPFEEKPKPPEPDLSLQKTEEELKRESMLHKSVSYRRQHDGGFFTTGGNTSNLCAFQVP